MKLKVLIAEDEPAHAEAIRRALSKADGAFEVRVSGTLREFQEMAAAEPPDMALLDLNLPDGRAVEILTSPPEAGPFPVLIMTSYGSEQAAVEAMKNGALDYLVKSPETFSGMPRILERALREWRLLQEKNAAGKALRESEEALRVHQIELEMQNEELRQAQEKLEISRAKYFDLYDLAPVGYFTLNEKGLILESNLTGASLLGVARGTLAKWPLTRFILPEDQDIYYRHHKLLLETGAPQECEMRMLRTEGAPFWVRLDALAAPDPDGSFICRVVMTDIHARKQAEEMLFHSHQRFEMANRATFDAIWDLDFQSNSVWRNENFETLFGYRAEELEPTVAFWTSLVHPEDRERVKAGISLAIDSNRELWSARYRFRRNDGTYAAIEDRGFICREEGGKPLRMIGAMQDISERERIAETLERNRNELQAIYEHAPMMMCVIDGTRRVLYANQVFTEFAGVTETEIKAGRALGVLGCINAQADPRGCGFGTNCPECPLRLAIEETFQTGRSKLNIQQSMVLSRSGRPSEVFLTGSTALIPTPGRPSLLICLEDITAQKQSELKLRESETLYRDLVENSQDLICTHDLEGRLLSLNEAGARNIGYDREFLLNRNLADFLDPAVRHLFAGYLSEIKETGRSQGVLRVLNAAGEIRLWEYNNTLRTEGVAVPLVRGMAHDITERHQAEQALLLSESKYRRLYDSLMDAYVSVDMTGRIREFNSAYKDLLGYSEEELYRLTYVDLTPERWQLKERDLVEKQILVKGYSDIYEKEYRRKDGSEFPVELRTFLIRDSAGRPEGMWAIVRDISDRKRVEEALRKTEEKYSKAFQASPDWVVITTLEEGVFIEVNKAFERLSGFGREEILGRTALEIGIWDKPEDRDHLIDLLRREGGAHNMEVRFRLRSGAVRTFLLSAEMVELEGKVCVLTVARDMTELRSLEGQLRQAQKMEAVGRLAGGVAHDFNNMLGVILGYTDLALKRLNAQEPLYHDLQEVNNAARRSADLTRQLLAFSRKQIVTPKVVNLNDAVAQQQKMLSRLIGEDIDLKFIPGQDLWNVRLDSSQVDQILANLAVNARDAIAGVGTVTIETANVTLDEGYTQRYRYATPGDYVLLAVSDSGSGMDGGTLEQIFEPFFTTKGEGQGTGLGLSTVYGIVKQNGGSIQAYSEPGRGTTFKIYFPRFSGEAVPVEPVTETPLSGSETVLIVEDEPQILLLAKRILEHYGYKTITAGTPGEALLLLEKYQGPLQLLLTDVIMPHMTGLELKGRVEALRPRIKTLFMSGYTAEVIALRGLLDESRAFIQKPFTVQGLAGKVRRVLDS